MGGDAPRPRRAPWLEIGVAAGIVAILALALGVTLWITQRRMANQRMQRVGSELQMLACACELYRGYWGQLPALDDDSVENQEVYEHLHKSPSAVGATCLVWPVELRNRKGSMLDPWDIPYRFRLFTETRIPPGNPIGILHVWSCGPNQKDENGEGDDIAIDVGRPDA